MACGMARQLRRWVVRSSLFITADELPSGIFSLVHLTAIYSLGMMSSFFTRRSRP